jgi:uncharacterized protein with ParB-like and HNH nuclease domain
MKYADIPKLTSGGNYRVNCSWDDLIDSLDRYQNDTMAKLDMNPEFQRGHVWTEEQQIQYLEFKIRGGSGSNEIKFNCVGWMNGFAGPFVLVDGKQRIEAVTRFAKNEIRAFGYFLDEFEDKKLLMRRSDFIFCINNLDTQEDVLRWYLELNSGGTPHTKEELDKVKKMMWELLWEE